MIPTPLVAPPARGREGSRKVWWAGGWLGTLCVALAVFGALSLLGPMVGTLQGHAFAVLCGAAWGFHICFTVNNFMQRQTDLEAYGFFFSFAFIVALNLLVLCLVQVALTRIGLHDMAAVCGDRIADTYLWFWDRFWGLTGC